MDQPTDRRILRTKAVIRDAMTELIEKKGFEALTVKDITTRARINRGTFYLHYRDKYDLLEQSEQELIEGLIAIISTLQPFNQELLISMDKPVPQIVNALEYINEHADFLKTILGPKGDPAFHPRLKSMMWKYLFEKNVTPFIKKENALVPTEYLVAYIASAHMGIIQEWLKQGRRESPYEIALIMTKINLKGPLYAAGIFKQMREAELIDHEEHEQN
ncbi:TetR/AcrR family transcriptional regulator [Paenibacillus sp. KQZ6P-2]|uniref:TetR/AcrR family transcriptional regulator n=1 Tax=Paenibacillus mangrovi TaxID=2931978 RepID=A0A9X2B4S1_9BACL|nr:TetR/AcrR family transcriptional regulator [Paenibacillus mangrovi]MCJ8014939.1 TetR/AcrR family transcriptional regulator [Paenibacillus mangrovi]